MLETIKRKAGELWEDFKEEQEFAKETRLQAKQARLAERRKQAVLTAKHEELVLGKQRRKELSSKNKKVHKDAFFDNNYNDNVAEVLGLRVAKDKGHELSIQDELRRLLG